MKKKTEFRLKKSPTEHSEKVRFRVLNAMKRLMMSHNSTVRTRTAFGLRVHVQPPSITRWDNLDGFPTVENLCDICLEFGISADWLLLGKGNMFGDAQVTFEIDELKKRVSNVESKLGIKLE